MAFEFRQLFRKKKEDEEEEYEQKFAFIVKFYYTNRWDSLFEIVSRMT